MSAMSAMSAGVYLCIHEFPVLGGCVLILSIFVDWGFEKGGGR